MKKLLLIILIIVLSSNVFAGIAFIPSGSVDIIEGETLIIDIVSDTPMGYSAYLDCDGAVITEPIPAPAAGTGGYVMPDPDPEYCGYYLTADDPLSLPLGTHFTFLLLTYAGDAGQSYTLTLYDDTITTVLDTLVVNVLEADCVASDASFYADWVEYGKPDCWCYQWQCRGDYDGMSVGTQFTGIRQITTSDLVGLLGAFNVYEPGGILNSGPGVLSIDGGNGVCADFDHSGVGTPFTGIRRVTTDDLNIILDSFNVYEPGGVLNSGPGVEDCPPLDYWGGWLNPVL